MGKCEIIICILSSLIPGSLWSQTSLKDLVNQGLTKSYKSKIRKLNQGIAAREFADRYTPFLPTIDLSAGRNYSWSEQVSDDFKLQESVSNTADVSISLPLWDNGNRVTEYERAKLAKDLSDISIFKETQDYVLEVLRAWYELQTFYGERTIKRSERSNVRKSFLKAKELVALGMKTPLDVYDLNIRLDRLRRDLIKLKTDQETAQKKLNLLVDPEVKILVNPVNIVKNKPWFVGQFLIALPQIRAQIAKGLPGNHPDIRIAKIGEEQAKLNYLQSTRDRWPQVAASAGYTFDFSPAVNSQEEDYGRSHVKGANIALSLSWDLWDWYSIERRVNSSYDNLDIQRLEMKQSQRSATLDLKNKLHSYDLVSVSLKISKKILNKAIKQYRFSREMYKLGKITVLELKEATLTLAESRLDLVNSVKDSHLLMAEILNDYGISILPP